MKDSLHKKPVLKNSFINIWIHLPQGISFVVCPVKGVNLHCIEEHNAFHVKLA